MSASADPPSHVLKSADARALSWGGAFLIAEDVDVLKDRPLLAEIQSGLF